MNRIMPLLNDHRFGELFLDELGWDRSSGTTRVEVDGRSLSFEAVAQKRGFQVLRCIANRRILFNRGLIRKVQRQVAKTVHEHILIYACDSPPKQVWQWAVHMPDGRKLRHREHPFFSGSPPEGLLSRLGRLRFALEEEDDVTFVDALQRVRSVLDVSTELNLFAKRPKYAEQSDELAIAMARGDAGAFHAFILLHRPLARHVAKRLQRAYWIDAEDAEQIGILGLIAAAHRYDPERGTQFSTYAMHWVRQACQRYGPDAALPIRLPAYVVQSFFPLRRHMLRLASEFGPARANDELARLCSKDRRFYRQWLAFERALSVRSLDDRSEDEYFEARELVDTLAEEPAEALISEEWIERLRAALSNLDERDRRLLRGRYGFDGPPQTLEEIGQAEGLTRERIRQIQAVAERKLRFHVMRELKDLVPEAPSV
jgi:RNA polymerase primary sigma factor